jgi:hypothetical protein
MNWFLLAYYVSTDIGSLAAGAGALMLARRGLPVHTSRLAVFAACALLCTLAGTAAFLPRGPLLLGVLLVIGFGALGLFPNYYSFSQELTARHQGKVTGALGCSCWLAMAPVHEAVGDVVKQTGSYSAGMAAAGFAPLVGAAALFLFWRPGKVVAVPHAEAPADGDTVDQAAVRTAEPVAVAKRR